MPTIREKIVSEAKRRFELKWPNLQYNYGYPGMNIFYLIPAVWVGIGDERSSSDMRSPGKYVKEVSIFFEMIQSSNIEDLQQTAEEYIPLIQEALELDYYFVNADNERLCQFFSMASVSTGLFESPPVVSITVEYVFKYVEESPGARDRGLDYLRRR